MEQMVPEEEAEHLTADLRSVQTCVTHMHTTGDRAQLFHRAKITSCAGDSAMAQRYSSWCEEGIKLCFLSAKRLDSLQTELGTVNAHFVFHHTLCVDVHYGFTVALSVDQRKSVANSLKYKAEREVSQVSKPVYFFNLLYIAGFSLLYWLFSVCLAY